MATAATEVQTKFQMIDLGKISESPMNPRKHFDPQSLKELAESIKAHGVQQPIVVRPDGNKQDRFEIVVGARRSRAAKLAGVKEIPAVIRELSNAAALEIMVIENLQREDVHPLDEALGYEALMKKASETDAELGELPGAPRHTAESIAAKVGKSVGYVYARLKLLALVPAAREAFQNEHITAGHAVLIARLQAGDQLKALAACFKNYVSQNIKKLDPTKASWAELGDAVGLDLGDDEPMGDTWIGMPSALRLASEKFLREWIQEHINLKLAGVPWHLDDEKLLPEAGACVTCPKRSMSNPALFAELTKKGENDTCFDPSCFQAKQKAFVKLQVKAAKTSDAPLVQISEQTAYTKPKEGEKILKKGQWLPAKKGECEGVTKALIVRGENAGEQQLVCADLNCKVHKRHLSSGGTSFDSGRSAEDVTAQREDERINNLVVERILESVVAKIKKPDLKVLRTLFEVRTENWYGDYPMLARALGLKFKDDQDAAKAVKAFAKKANLAGMMRLVFLVSVSEEMQIWTHEFKSIVKVFGLDIAKTRKLIEKEVQTPEKPLAKKAKAGK
jgi:ParB family transcriptional regulator, chromosome partitioning protein